MKFFQSELVQSYQSYSFGYCNYAVKEESDTLSALYDRGYLPYSGTKGLTNVFYMARSIRIDLDSWKMNSENRRVYKRFDGELERTRIPFHEFDHTNETFLQFCLDYFVKRHGAHIMPRERLLLILNCGLISHIIVYKHAGVLVGYVLIAADPLLEHFWYSFYELSYMNQSLGLWLMTDAIMQAQALGKAHFYLGTAYGEKGLYKTNFDALSYWNGHSWENDVAVLRQRCRTDNERAFKVMDEWKQHTSEALF